MDLKEQTEDYTYADIIKSRIHFSLVLFIGGKCLVAQMVKNLPVMQETRV